MVRRGDLKQMESVLLQAIGFVAGEHHVYRQPLALCERLNRLGRGIVQFNGIDGVVEDVRLMDKRFSRDGVIGPGIKQQGGVQYLFHLLFHQRLQVLLGAQLAHADRLIVRQQLRIIICERFVALLIENMTSHAGGIGDLTSLMHEAQQIGIGIVPRVHVPDLVAAGHEYVVLPVQFLQLFDGFIEFRRKSQCLMLQCHEIVVTLLDQLVMEKGIQILGDVFRAGHFLVHVIEVLLARCGKVDDIAFVAKLFDGFLRGERLQERAIVVGRVVSDQCGLHCASPFMAPFLPYVLRPQNKNGQIRVPI